MSPRTEFILTSRVDFRLYKRLPSNATDKALSTVQSQRTRLCTKSTRESKHSSDCGLSLMSAAAGGRASDAYDMQENGNQYIYYYLVTSLCGSEKITSIN